MKMMMMVVMMVMWRWWWRWWLCGDDGDNDDDCDDDDNDDDDDDGDDDDDDDWQSEVAMQEVQVDTGWTYGQAAVSKKAHFDVRRAHHFKSAYELMCFG